MPKESNKQPGKIRRTLAGIRLIFKLLGVHDEYRIEMALDKLKRSQFGIYLTNIFVFAVLACVKISSLIRDKWSSLFTNKKHDFSHLWDDELPPRIVQSKPRILIVGEMLNKQCRLYRVEQKQQQFERLGWHCEVFSWQQLVEAQARLSYVDIVIFYRVVGTPKVLALIDYVRSQNKITVFDVDDLVFDKALLEQKYLHESELLSDEVKQGNLHAADLYKTAVEHCDYAITTTKTLQSLLSKLVIHKQCFILPNALPEEAYQVAELPLAKKDIGKLTLLYGSGSQTHDDDFQEVANALARLMKRHKELQIAVLGKLNLPTVLNHYADRIIQLPILDFASYLMFVRQSDINIAPLQQDIFTDAKSEIKWLEAALFSVPTVMTPTQTYQQVVEPGVTGFFAESEEQWFSHLNNLIEDLQLRQEIGNNAKRAALTHYGRDVMPEKLSKVMDEIQAHALSKGVLHKRLSKTKKSIMVVESYYSPRDAEHDPMLSVRRQIEQIVTEYGDEYEILIVTADSQDTDKYVVNEYALNGVRIRAMGVGVQSEQINDYQNPRIKKTFKDVLDYFSPDLIHFHHLEVLSGSVIEVARENSIPYIVTIYDTSWWLTSGKYRTQRDYKPVLPELDPFSMVNEGISVNDKIIRSTSLVEHLSKAQRVFSLTPFQCDLLKLNGIDTILLPEGIMSTDSVIQQSQKSQEDNTNSLVGIKKVAVLGAHTEFDNALLSSLKGLSNEPDFSDIEFHQIDFTQLPDFCSDVTDDELQLHLRGSWLNQFEASQFIQSMHIIVLSPSWQLQSDLIVREAHARGTWVIIPQDDDTRCSLEICENDRVYSIQAPSSLTAVLQELLAMDRRPVEQGFSSLSANVKELSNHYQDIHSSIGLESL